MKNYLFILSFLLCYKMVSSQSTINVYLDENYNKTSFDSANYIRTAVIKSDHYYITDKDIKGKIINYCEYRSINPWIEDGLARHYAEPDLLYSTGYYKNGEIVGKWIYYDNDNIDTVNYDLSESFNSEEFCNQLKKAKVKKPSQEKENEIVDSIRIFFYGNFHLPARTSSISKYIDQKIELILDTDNRIKCPILNNVIDKDLEKEVLRVLEIYRGGFQLETPYKITFNYYHHGLIYDSTGVFVIVEQNPEFKYQDCNQSINCFNQYIKIRLSEFKFDCSETIMVQFIIEIDGRIENV